MLILGWDNRQWGHAKGRYVLHGNAEPQENMDGLLDVQQWWHKHHLTEPLEVRLERVVYESDNVWAARAMCAAAKLCVDMMKGT